MNISHILFYPLLLFSVSLNSQIQFTDITQVSGIGLPGILTESCAWGDYDNDGDQDLYLTNNGKNILFRNNGGDVFTDVTYLRCKYALGFIKLELISKLSIMRHDLFMGKA